MDTNAKRNEHPRCSCQRCKRGAGSVAGQSVHRMTNRRVRHAMRIALATRDPDTIEPVIVSTGYTD